ncbi:hypothetical protein CYMTET_36056 [Cymbomonas tetramitiformis]|uniref:Vacuolar protein-sorting-associated protein 36 n=1 Tax=Cymbomonas tetramitiformis TaxID=36881 RepID=A0AAE0F806_9CHLO|nr:hypothetical protein CYMTET_36056 [Cymbomonas tetramitiformis]
MACQLWIPLQLPLHLRTFNNGLMVVQAESYQDVQVIARIQALTGGKENQLGVGITVGECATSLNLPLPLAQEYLRVAEEQGLLCRDEAPEGLQFFHNFFPFISAP